MRIAVIILALTSIAVGLVTLRGRELRYRHQAQQLEMRRRALRPAIWRHEARIRRLVAAEAVNNRAVAMGLYRQGDRRRPLVYGTEHRTRSRR
ncbi:MAG: hypothetical protein KGY99_08620 [Phycisphaerae bacterium]|nr:hypothetical protein [Phycisphaerae bacterium]